ncbi:NAD-dependent epimerase/dehydratase family protein [Flammeovirga kamogawensis]|uniref:NAD-dependent epimerase/dehydratase family protein n=1 Tax=Flammeovirga kamogawensis TaxID=373891 RepID=A0ABX8GRT8_9BACT|nr:NAD-dependent epimerase/dehydratase family protein [Flammeovirga kamogawensis]MBB6463723.1 nucleoside-diphosphate-sugar epimerase [Flammeovirga kamogawensis]QWG06221.1 NAD-dependent epimerase/dehydratase family protein [Flammeovirga kamogawensis]
MLLEGKKVFITGATGFVGGYILKSILQTGAHVIALNGKRNDKSFLGDDSKLVTWVDIDILDPNSLLEELKEIDYVIHTASIVSFNTTLDDLRAVNVNGTANLVNISLQAGVKKFIHISSIAALGVPEYGNFIDENSKWTGDKGMSAYAISKYNAEQEVWRGYREGLDVVVLNPSVILGVGDWNRSSLTIFKTIQKGVKYYPSGLFSSVDVRDVTTAVIKAIELPISGERYILNASNLPFKLALETISNGLNVKAPNKKISKSSVNFIYYIEKVFSIFTGKSSQLSKDLIKSLFSRYEYDNKKAQDQIKIPFISLNDTMKWVNESL